MTDLAPHFSSGGKGKGRVQPEVESIIKEVIEQLYLCRQKRSIAVIVREIRMRCTVAGLPSPARNTVSARIRLIDPIELVRKREGPHATRPLQSAAGTTSPPAAPLDLVQMDHSPVDVIVVEEGSRLPIGRPYLTLAIDVFTRCIVGMLLTFEAPCAVSVGLCLAQMVTSKTTYLQRLGLDRSLWPMHGKPHRIYLDNAPEFKSNALERGCEQHGIERGYRPPGEPHFGGIIERVIGTAMTMVHELPGTTFSNIRERGHYDSESAAVLTLSELEKWLVLAIANYHGSVHSTLKTTPSAYWHKMIEPKIIHSVRDEKAFLIDFLPVIERSIGRVGFVVDYIAYYSDLLKPWIARREQFAKFVLRRDPRDISRIWVLDPSSKQYIELPYRSLSNPAVTLWEHRKAMENLRQEGRAAVDEAEIFRVIGKMRQIVEAAGKESKRARRDLARRGHLMQDKKVPVSLSPPKKRPRKDASVKRFDDIEEW